MKKKNKVVVLLSGGTDSALAFARSYIAGMEVYPLFINYGQQNFNDEQRAVVKLLDYYGMLANLRTMDLRSVFGESQSSLVKESEKESPILEFRNGVLIAVAVSYAQQIGADKVITGARYSASASGFSDCSLEFMQAMDDAAYWGTGNRVEVSTSIGDMDKIDTLQEAVKMKVPLKYTYSCYHHAGPCGKCRACKERKKAFKAVGIPDPLLEAQ